MKKDNHLELLKEHVYLIEGTKRVFPQGLVPAAFKSEVPWTY